MSKLDADLPDEWSHGERAQLFLIVSVVATIVLQRIPWLGWPFVLLSTLAHELGHGVAALLVGGGFRQFHVYADASGLAECFPAPGAGGLSLAAISAGGLVGPAVVAAGFFLAARRPLPARVFLVGCGLALLVVVALLVREAFGAAFILAVAAILLGTGARAPAWGCQLLLAFLAVQLALSVWSRGDYLFTEVAHVNGRDLPSDVASMAKALGGPYWFWGFVCGLASVLALVVGGFALLWGHSTPRRRDALRARDAASPRP